MSEHMPAEIWVGGKIPVSLVPDICTTITRQNVALEWGGCDFCPATAEDLTRAVKADKAGVPALWLCDDEARWGEFASLERFLQENEIAFTRLSAGRHDYDPEMMAYHPDIGRIELATNNDGEPVIPASRLAGVEVELARLVNAGRIEPMETVLRSIRSALGSLRGALPPPLPPLEPFEIVPCTERQEAVGTASHVSGDDE